MAYFNYSTGPVELSPAARAGLIDSPGSSHSPDAQEAIAETIALVKESVGLPPETVVILMPGSIRQALDATVRAAASFTSGTSTLRSGYWSHFVHGLAARYGEDARMV